MKLNQQTKNLTLCIRKNLKIGVMPAVFIPLVISFSVFAGPTGGNIVGGAGHINHAGLNTNIHQHTSRLAIDWDTFNIDSNESVNFNQPGRSSIVLNRIQDANPTQIQGAINANGQVIIANPNGVFFGKNSSVNVGGLFASALSIDPQKFMQGEINFKALENTRGIIANEGTLQVIDGGTLALLGQQVENKGLLIANFGLVALAAGSDITVKFDEDRFISIQINQSRLAEILQLDSPTILNSGIIQAFDGRVVLTAQQATAIRASSAGINPGDRFSFSSGTLVEKDGVVYLAGPDGDISDLVAKETGGADEIRRGVISDSSIADSSITDSFMTDNSIIGSSMIGNSITDSIITDTGRIDVSSNSGNGGTVIYRAGNINHSGTINADSNNGNGGTVSFNADNTTLLTGNSTVSAQSNKNGSGGKVQVLGNLVGLTDKAGINASGAKGGGEILIGGDYQGGNYQNSNYQSSNKTIKNAEAVYLGKDTSIKANATENGDGGKVIVWSDDRTRAYGDISATGGKQSGNGGFIETSSKNYVDLQTRIDVSAQNGQQGEWLIDPSSLTIDDGSGNGGVLKNGSIFQSAINNSSLDRVTLLDALSAGANITIQTSTILDAATQTDLNPETSADPGNSYGDITLSVNLDIDNIGGNRDTENASSLTLRAHRDIIINGAIFDSDGDNGLGRNFTPDGDILNLTLVADWGGINGNEGTAGLGSVRINNNINLQGGNFSASGVDFIQAANTTIDTRIPLLDLRNETGFVVDDVFGAGAVTPNGRVSINVQNSATLGSIITRASTGNLSVTANAGPITQIGALDIAGTTALASNGVIDLSNTGNDFAGAVSVSRGTTVTLNDINDLTLGNVSNVATLNATATNSVNQQALTNINTTGSTSRFIAGIDITLALANNPVTGIQLNAGNNVTLTGAGAIKLGSSTIGNNLNVTAGGNITDAGVIDVTNTATFNAGTNAITLNTNTHQFNNIQIASAGAVDINEANNIRIAGTMSRLKITSGLAGAASTIANILNSALNVTNTADFTLQNGGSIGLNNFNNAGRNNLQGTINIASNGGSLNNVRLRNTGDISLASMTLGADLVLNTLGNISQSGAFSVAGNTSLQANNITLLQNNDFANLTLINSNFVQLNDASGGINVIASNANGNNAIDLNLTSSGAVGIEGQLLNLAINSNNGNIQNTAALTVSNNTTLDAGSGDIDFQTVPVNLENLDITQASNVLINDTSNLTISNASVNNLLDITAAGPVSVNATTSTLNVNTANTLTLSGSASTLNVSTTTGGIQNGATALTVTGLATLDAGNSDINLGAANDFNQLAITRAQDVTVNDTNAIELQNINTRDFNLTTGGNITQANVTQANITQATGTVINSTRGASINAGSADILLGENNVFTALALNANAATVVNNQALVLNDSTLGDSLNLTTQNGNLSINRIRAANNVSLTTDGALLNLNGNADNIVASSATLQANSGIGNGSPINTRVASLRALNTGTGDISISNAGGNITLDRIENRATDTGNFNFITSNDVIINKIILDKTLAQAFFNNGTGTVNMFSADGSFLGVGTADINSPDITATNLRIIGVKGTLGTIQRPMVLDISGKVELLMRASLNPTYAPPAPLPGDIQDDSIFRFISIDTLSAVNGVQLTEVENIRDINPAIFTDIRHFLVSAEPVMLPKDQRFGEEGYTLEEDDAYFRQATGQGENGHGVSN